MNKEQERQYASKIFILTIVLMVVSVAGFIYACYTFFHGEPINNNIFEMIFYGGHILILVMAIYFSYTAKNKGLYIIKKLMYVDERGNKSTGAFVISWVFVGLSFLVFIYFLLTFFIPALPTFHFPILLRIILIVSPLTVWSIGLFFAFHPIINQRLKKQR